LDEVIKTVLFKEVMALEKNELWLKIQEILGAKLEETEELLQDYTVSNVVIMQDLMDHIVSSSGKRLRPILLLLSGSFKPVHSENLIRAAAAVELIHTASLIHDDILDESQERRGKPSINALWGNRLAVLAGDFLFSRAFELVALCRNYELLKVLSRAIGTMCEGEIEQVRFAFNLQLNEQQYMQNIYRKTAALMEACCSAGGRLAGLDDAAVLQLEAYGRNLGLAFQITDDILDITGESLITGKPVGNDLREGIITLPLIYVLEDPIWGPYLKESIEKRDFSPSTLEFLQHPSCINEPLKRSLNKARLCLETAREYLSGFTGTVEGEILDSLAGYVLQRKL
jgi:heptaprenyl diphosphate synthase